MKSIISLSIIICSTILISGCVAGKQEYFKPIRNNQIETSKIVDEPKDISWNKTISELGKKFFVINNMDKASGFINISFSGNPEKYLDCGTVSSYVSNLVGERTYTFPGSSALKQYEIMYTEPRIALYQATRRMSLEGRINLIFEQISEKETKVNVISKYVINKTIIGNYNPYLPSINSNESITFSSNEIGRFSESQTECISNGKLEEEVLETIK